MPADTAQGIFRVHEGIPVRGSELTLLYPEWIPGNHSPSGPIDMLAGLTVTAERQVTALGRAINMTSTRSTCEVPRDVSSVECRFPVPLRPHRIAGHPDDG